MADYLMETRHDHEELAESATPFPVSGAEHPARSERPDTEGIPGREHGDSKGHDGSADVTDRYLADAAGAAHQRDGNPDDYIDDADSAPVAESPRSPAALRVPDARPRFRWRPNHADHCSCLAPTPRRAASPGAAARDRD